MADSGRALSLDHRYGNDRCRRNRDIRLRSAEGPLSTHLPADRAVLIGGHLRADSSHRVIVIESAGQDLT
jgi:hypothetical protein